jgi:hypothetical protein
LQRGAKFSGFYARKRLQKNLNSGDHFDGSFSLYRSGIQTTKPKKERNNNESKVYGFLFLIGDFTAVYHLIQPPTGNGEVINVCDLID